MKFINHWSHSHFIIWGIQWGGGFSGKRTIEVTLLNFGIEFKIKETAAIPVSPVKGG